MDDIHACDDVLLTAEVVEAMRSAPLAPAAIIPAGVSPTETSVHDLPLVRPATVDCGWPPALRHHLEDAEAIRNSAGTAIRLRTTSVALYQLLCP